MYKGGLSFLTKIKCKTILDINKRLKKVKIENFKFEEKVWCFLDPVE